MLTEEILVEFRKLKFKSKKVKCVEIGSEMYGIYSYRRVIYMIHKGKDMEFTEYPEEICNEVYEKIMSNQYTEIL